MERSHLGHTSEQLQIRLSVMETSASSLDREGIVSGYRKTSTGKKYNYVFDVGLCQSGEVKVTLRNGMRLLLPSDLKGLTRSCLAPDFPALDWSRVREPLHLLLTVLGSLSLRNSCSGDISLPPGPRLQVLCLV